MQAAESGGANTPDSAGWLAARFTRSIMDCRLLPGAGEPPADKAGTWAGITGGRGRPGPLPMIVTSVGEYAEWVYNIHMQEVHGHSALLLWRSHHYLVAGSSKQRMGLMTGVQSSDGG